MQKLSCGSFVRLLALDHQQVLLGGNVDISRLEPGDGQGDAIDVFAPALDIEGGVIIAAVQAVVVFQQIKQPVKANHGAAIGGKIKAVHDKILQ